MFCSQKTYITVSLVEHDLKTAAHLAPQADRTNICPVYLNRRFLRVVEWAAVISTCRHVKAFLSFLTSLPKSARAVVL